MYELRKEEKTGSYSLFVTTPVNVGLVTKKKKSILFSLVNE